LLLYRHVASISLTSHTMTAITCIGLENIRFARNCPRLRPMHARAGQSPIHNI
jgi:hypothetical protein